MSIWTLREEHRPLAPWAIRSTILSLLVWTSAPAADCNSNGVPDDLDLTLPVLRTAELSVPFSDELAWGQPLAVDFDGDGLPDLAALEGPELSDGGRDHAIWMNRGGGRFDAATRYSTGTIGRWATAADLDGDGDPDLVTVTHELMTILIGLNDGEGRISDPLRYPMDHYPRHVIHGDFDGDGRIDLATAHVFGATVHTNGGGATFTVRRDVGPQVLAQRVAAADLDGDGDLDLALLTEVISSADIVLLSNHGDGTFEVLASLQLAGELRHAVFEDLDADGDADLSATMADPSPQGDGRLALFSNDGHGVFGPEVSHRLRTPPVYLAPGDLDQDGDADLFVSSEDFVLFRNAGGAFSGPELLEQASTAGFFVVRDLDKDGAPEVWKHKEGVPRSLGVLSLVVAPWSIDCDLDNIPDECGADCNRNRRADVCDAADGPDCNRNLIPDACEADCNRNDIPDECDVVAGTSPDCNGNLLPDECEPADCNQNQVPDDCDIAVGRSQDCNGNHRPDECEGDCNSTGIPDDCDVVRGTSLDVNQNAIPDECEVQPSFLYDFEQGSAVPGTPGGKARLEVRSRIHIIGLAPGVNGTQGWNLFAVTTGCVPISATTAGTAAANVTDDPPGLVRGGFHLIRLVNRRELQQIGLPQDGGYTSATILGLQEPVSLDPAGSPYGVARATLEGLVPPTGCAECLVEYANWRNGMGGMGGMGGDGTGGSGGLPGDNVVTFRGATVYARREGLTARFCEAQFHRGDANGDGRNDVSDAISIFSYLFLGGPAPGCREATNTDDSPVLDISDGIFLLTFLYLGGVVPPPPGAPSRAPCGPDPGGPSGNLGCERYDGCG